MNTITLLPLVGNFAENKDTAREIRIQQIAPLLEKGEEVVLDFSGVEAATQSFIHALISDLIRIHGGELFSLLYFKNCTETVRKIITIVSDYMMESE